MLLHNTQHRNKYNTMQHKLQLLKLKQLFKLSNAIEGIIL